MTRGPVKKRHIRRLAVLLLTAALLLTLTGCVRTCSFCGQRSIFYDRTRLHGVELVICSRCQGGWA